MNERQKLAHMEAAGVYARLSYCYRRQVGCVIVKDNRIISIGYNGTPPGEDNCCEDENGITKPNVIHAEMNALSKLALGEAAGSSLFVSVSPCINCANEIVKHNVKEVFYETLKNTNVGLPILRDNGISVTKMEKDDV